MASRPDVGGWLPWAGMVLAVLWWGSVVAAFQVLGDMDWVRAQPLALLVSAALMFTLPGVMLIMAGFMAREGKRAAAANALVLEAARHLLSPAREVAGEGEHLAERLKRSSFQINEAAGQALGSLKAVSAELGDERLRIESVAYAAADNARNLGEQLARERQALEALARDLDARTEAIASALPRQAERMMEALRRAGEQVRDADRQLEQRLSAMDATREALTGELGKLGLLASDAHDQAETLLYAVSRIEEKLDQSRKAVDAAVRAGEMAATAASSTGDALNDAVSSALDNARRASTDINAETRQASEETSRAITRLGDAAREAQAAIRAAGLAARAETDVTERRLAQLSGALQRVVSNAGASLPTVMARSAPPSVSGPATTERGNTAPPAARSAGEAAQPAPPAEVGINGNLPVPQSAPPKRTAPDITHAGPLNGSFARPAVREAPRPAAATDAEIEAPAPAASIDDADLFEAAADRLAALHDPVAINGRSEPAAPPAAAPALSARKEGPRPVDPAVDERDSLSTEDVAPVRARREDGTEARRSDGWATLISDLERAESGRPSREQTAETVISRLESSGIPLSAIFRPRDKRRIAQATRKGDAARREAITGAAGSEVERVRKRLMADPDLNRLALDFVEIEASDALVALDQTQKSGRNASARLSAFLLLDAALD